MTSQNDETWITLSSAAKKLGISQTTLKRWSRLGKIDMVQDPITNCRQYRLEDVEALVEPLNHEDPE